MSLLASSHFQLDQILELGSNVPPFFLICCPKPFPSLLTFCSLTFMRRCSKEVPHFRVPVAKYGWNNLDESGHFPSLPLLLLLLAFLKQAHFAKVVIINTWKRLSQSNLPSKKVHFFSIPNVSVSIG